MSRHHIDTTSLGINTNIRDIIPTENPYLATEQFIASCEQSAFKLPSTLISTIDAFSKTGNKHGYLLLRSLPTDPELPDTPTLKDNNAQHKHYFYSEFWLTSVANILGEPFSYIQEASGHLFHDIRPIKKNATKLSSQSSDILLDFHTETAFHPTPPDFLLLYCLRHDREQQAQTIISSIRKVLPRLDNETINLLRQRRFKTGIDYSFGNQDGKKGNGPILSVLYGDPNDPFLIFDPDLMVGDTEEANNALATLKKEVDVCKEGILLMPGDLLIVDNRRSVHGRNQFNAFYDGKDRWLQRLLVMKDLSKSVIQFGKKERVITYQFDLENVA